MLEESDFPDAETVVLRVLYDYKPQIKGDLELKKGEFLDLLEKSSELWWVARKPSGVQGFVPANYVCIDNDTPQSQDCFFDAQRRDAERLLLAAGIAPGQFLVCHFLKLLGYTL